MSSRGSPIRNERFQDLVDVEAYDGIWACSSILHLPKAELPGVLALMVRALRLHGIIYTSFKLGGFDGMRNGRYFSDFTEPELRDLIGSIPQLA